MRVLIVLLAMVFGAAAAFGSDADREAIIAAKTKLDQAFQDNDAETIRAMMTDDHVAITTFYGGPKTVSEQIDTLKDLKAEFFDFSETVLTFLNDDTAWIRFENSYRGTFMGEPLPERVYVSEAWVKRDGTWLQKLYQETVIEPR